MFIDWLFKLLGGKMEVKNTDQALALTAGQPITMNGAQPGNDTDLQNAGLAIHVAGTAVPSTAVPGTVVLGAAVPGAVHIEAPLGEAGVVHVAPPAAEQPEGQHTHAVGGDGGLSHSLDNQPAGSHTHSYQWAQAAVISEVDKLEAAYSKRIHHIRALVDHLGKEAESEVIALFSKFPVFHGK